MGGDQASLDDVEISPRLSKQIPNTESSVWDMEMQRGAFPSFSSVNELTNLPYNSRTQEACLFLVVVLQCKPRCYFRYHEAVGISAQSR